MPQETKTLETTQAISDSPQGQVASRADASGLEAALEKAFDYRGDVTLTLTDGRVLVGYVFDRRVDGQAGTTLRVLPADGSARVSVRAGEIDRIEFTGKDTAHGKGFETWVKKFTEKRLKGERASIESEEL